MPSAASEEGIEYHFDRITRSPNTVDAHRLIHWSAAEGVEDDMVERLFAAYFSEGLDIGDPAVLANLAGDVGLDAGDCRRAARRRRGPRPDRRRDRECLQDRCRGVPCFIIDRRLAVTGAHPPEVLVQAIEQAVAERAVA